MKKFPNRINKINTTIELKNKKIDVQLWYDRWDENLWAFGRINGKQRLIVPVELRQVRLTIEQLFKLVYFDKLVYSINPFFSLIPKHKSKGALYHQPVVLGVVSKKP